MRGLLGYPGEAEMSGTQTAARKTMERFVAMQGGDPRQISVIGNFYRWTAPDGREASVAWI